MSTPGLARPEFRNGKPRGGAFVVKFKRGNSLTLAVARRDQFHPARVAEAEHDVDRRGSAQSSRLNVNV